MGFMKLTGPAVLSWSTPVVAGFLPADFSASSMIVGKASQNLNATRAIWDLEPAIEEFIEFDFFHARSGLGRTKVETADFEALQARLAPLRFDLAGLACLYNDGVGRQVNVIVDSKSIFAGGAAAPAR